MILTCPACRKKYLIPDSAIGAEGRQVRCAACRHSWFEAATDPLTSITGITPLTPMPTQSVQRHIPETPPEPNVLPPSWRVATDPANAGAVSEPLEDDYDPYAPEPPFRGRANTSRRWTIAAVAASLLLIGGIGAVYYFGSPTWVPSVLSRLGFNFGSVDTPLIIQFSSDTGPKAGMPPGPRFVTIHGQIFNPTERQQRVPDIIAELLDSHGRVVYSWTITPQKRTIAARGNLPIDDTAVSTPVSASASRLTFSGVDPH